LKSKRRRRFCVLRPFRFRFSPPPKPKTKILPQMGAVPDAGDCIDALRGRTEHDRIIPKTGF
jgi:hypothetical protein